MNFRYTFTFPRRTKTSNLPAMNKTYPRPSLTADIVVLRYRNGHLEILLIERSKEPYEQKWALPGGFVDENEEPFHAAKRELMEETSVSDLPMIELGTFGKKDRDPRGWVVSVAFLAFAHPTCEAVAGDDAAMTAWYRLHELPELAFDHADIVASALKKLTGQIQFDTMPLFLLPTRFRSRQARHLYSQIIGKPIKPRPFKAWLRRRQAIVRVGPGTYTRAESMTADWCRS